MADVGPEALGKDVFLQLLTTQLQYQDPLDPTDSTQFVAELAQFTQLEQTSEMNAQLSKLVEGNILLNNFGATSLIGKEVQVEGGLFSLVEGSASDFSYQLSGDAQEVVIQIVDGIGDVVRTFNPGAQQAGIQRASWDGRDANGNPLPAGDYSFNISARDQAGGPVSSETFSSGIVSGVLFENGAPFVTVNGGNIPASDVISVR
ncbi:Flagellar basal-body rod modification protein FlgD [hydrothermal vent metagenome]|uniref:Flagellar basal-body rod modification protein FlgD n=1 Tax=hydrothermal vent metagenome TaxID=652676 RepID=A0A3B1CJP4_9ZZZZ